MKSLKIQKKELYSTIMHMTEDLKNLFDQVFVHGGYKQVDLNELTQNK